MREVPL